MEKSLELKNLDLVRELVGLVFEYQNKGGGDAFFDISGHTQTYHLRLYDGLWSMGGSKTLEKTAHPLSEADLKDSISKIEKLISNIKPFDQQVKEAKEKELSDKKEQLEKLAKELNVKIVE